MWNNIIGNFFGIIGSALFLASVIVFKLWILLATQAFSISLDVKDDLKTDPLVDRDST